MARSQFGQKMQRKSWNSSDINQEWEDKKIGITLLVVFVAMILLTILMWWVRQHLHR
jgi:hypothetical protein